MDVYHYKSFNGCLGFCGLSIQIENGVPKVTLTELEDNTGMSITNMFEVLATMVFSEKLSKYNPEAIQWVEHYQRVLLNQQWSQSWDTVTLQWDPKKKSYSKPQWQHIRSEPLVKNKLSKGKRS